jgi:hypothetical protein
MYECHFFCWLYSPRGPWPLLSVSWSFLQTVGLLGRVISSSQGLYLNTGQHKHRTNTYTHQTPMPWVGFETTTPASERAKTVHALDRSATVTGLNATTTLKKIRLMWRAVQSSVQEIWTSRSAADDAEGLTFQLRSSLVELSLHMHDKWEV